MATPVLLSLRTRTNVIINHVQRRNMPVNVPPTATGKRRFRLAVETDPHKLVNYCCGLNYHIDEPPIKLQPDENYPDWLWSLRLTDKPNSWELEEGSKEYYLRLNEETFQANYIKRQKQQIGRKVVGQVLLKQQDYLRAIRFAALAHLEPDIGTDGSEIEIDWHSKEFKRLEMRRFYLPMQNRKLYMDKLPTKKSNYYKDESSTFKKEIPVTPRKPYEMPAIQDSKRRHPHSVH